MPFPTARFPELRRTGMNVAILGCGSLGGVMAARLAGQQEIRLTVLNRNPRIAEAVSRQGLVLREGRRTRTVSVDLAEKQAGPPYDALLLATKATGLVEEVGRLLPHLADDAIVITSQNGLVALDLEPVVGPRRLIPGCVLWGSSMDAPGEYRITAHGPFVIGSLAGESASAGLKRARALLSFIFPAVVTRNIRGVLWSKLAVTASFTTLGGLTGLTFGQLAARRRTRTLMLALGAEVLAVSRLQGVRLEPLAAGLNVERLLSADGYPAFIKHLLVRGIGHRHRRTESSLLDSLRRGRKTEIDFVNGRVVELAGAAGVAVPYNRLAVRLVRELEAGSRKPSPENLEAFSTIAGG